MKTKTIFTKDYILLCKETYGFKTGNWNYEPDNTIRVYKFDYDIDEYPGQKILAYKKLNPKASDLDDLPLLPDWNKEVDIEQMAELEYREYPNSIKNTDYRYGKDVNCFRKRKAFIKGFKKSQELNKDKLFTLEDVEKVIDLVRKDENRVHQELLNYFEGKSDVRPTAKSKEEIIQQLQRFKLPKEFVPTYIDTNSFWGEVLTGSYDSGNFILKTIDTPQGKQVIGKWVL